jgi:hypothetical protein
MRTILICLLLCPGVRAQEKWDISTLFGAAGTSSILVPAGAVSTTPAQPAAFSSGSMGWTWQWTSAHRFRSSAAGSLYWYWEVPLTFFHGGDVVGLERAGDYFTPGIRLKIPLKTRVSFYGALGGGISQFNEKDALIHAQLTAAQDPSSAHPAADFGGGIDLRLNQFVSLRLDGRDYITPAGLGGTTGRNHPLFMAGIAFHM